MKHFSWLLALLLLISVPGIAQNSKGWVPIFNGNNLDGWDTYLGVPIDSAGKRIGNTPIGFNNDPKQVFSVVKQDNVKVVRISGDGVGALISKVEYENYHLQLQFKWGTWRHPSRKINDSGLLYHSVGENGADSGAWMRSQEFQIQVGDCGDYIGCAGALADVPAINKVYTPGAALVTISAKSPLGRHAFKSANAEKPMGEWNTIDLYCMGDTSVHVVNGKVVMVLYHNQQQDKDQLRPLTKGKIQIQCEGAEVFYKDMKVQAITQLPRGLLNE